MRRHRTLEDKSGGGARLTDIYVLFPAQLTSSPASPHWGSDEVGYSNDLLCPQLIDDNGWRVTPWRRAPKIDGLISHFIVCIVFALQFKILVICSHLSHVAAAPGSWLPVTSWSRTLATASIQLQLSRPGLGWAVLTNCDPASCLCQAEQIVTDCRYYLLCRCVDIIYIIIISTV